MFEPWAMHYRDKGGHGQDEVRCEVLRIFTKRHQDISIRPAVSSSEMA